MSILQKFKNSALELSSVQTLCICSMMLALRIVLGMFTNFTLAIVPFVKIGLSFIPVVLTAMLYGPVCAAVVSGAGDVLSIILSNPTAFSIMPGITLCCVIEGIIYGIVLYKDDVTLKDIIIAKALVLVLCSLPLNTLVLSLVMNMPYFTLLMYRTLVLVPFAVVEVFISYFMNKAVKRIDKKYLGKNKRLS
ncbi:MAG: folate family ECF transporter S component [Oscillospiraceae bacterium]|nr:folate family ECF transporter S component [Candidatus Ruminococcus equi]